MNAPVFDIDIDIGQIYPIDAPAFDIDIGRICRINRIDAPVFNIDIDIVADGGRDGERIILRFHA